VVALVLGGTCLAMAWRRLAGKKAGAG
jgi:hypothetical protein